MEIVIYLIITLSGLYLISIFLRLVSPFFRSKPKTVKNVLHGYSTEVSSLFRAEEWPKEEAKKKILKIYYSKKSKKIFQFISQADSYTLSILDEKLVLLQDISLSIPKFHDGTGLTLKTFENGENEIIVFICGLDYYQFDMSGEKIYEKKFVKNYDETILVYHNSTEFTHINDYDNYSIKVIWIEDNTTFALDILHENFYSDENSFSYEYHLGIVSTNKKNQIAFIAHHANYGAQGIQIYEFSQSKKLSLLYHLYDEELDGSFNHLAFNPAGDKFAVLLYQRDKSGNDYFSILEYSVLDDKKPIRIIETKFAWQDFHELQTHYITDKLFCIVRNCDLIIYDIAAETLLEVIKRDLRSAYHVNFNILIYQKHDKVLIREYN